MREEIRPSVVFIAAKLIGDIRGGSVYDFSRGTYSYFSGHVRPTVAIYDHSTQSHVTGSPANLFHHGTGQHIQLRIDGSRFSGFDYGTGQQFSGTVNRRNVQVFDYDGGGWHHYLIT